MKKGYSYTTTDGKNHTVFFGEDKNTGNSMEFTDDDNFLYNPEMINYIKQGEKQIERGEYIRWRNISS
jgi:hypothetical protein